MLRLSRMPLQHHRFKALCQELTSLGRSMTLQLSLCEQIADRGVHKHYAIINVILRTTCDYCLESGNTRKLHNGNSDSEVLISSPAWAFQVEQLSGLMISLAHKVSQTSFSPSRSVEPLLRSLAGLSTALSRQRRHMEHTSVCQRTEMNVIVDNSTVCPDCGHPYTATATDESDQCI
jgi:hypothetical protein